METLKPLDQLTAPDGRHRAFARMDESAPGFRRPLALEDQYSKVAELELADTVPESVRSAFAVARMLWIHGWFYWPFYTLAGFHAYLCLDMALAMKIITVDGITDPGWRTPSLSNMFDRALRERWIQDEGIAHAKRFRDQAREQYDSLPEEWRSQMAPDPWADLDQRYCQILGETIPSLRNTMAHPKQYWHGSYGDSRLDLENVHGLIQQLFSDAIVA
jgi:hypothetical protein